MTELEQAKDMLKHITRSPANLQGSSRSCSPTWYVNPQRVPICRPELSAGANRVDNASTCHAIRPILAWSLMGRSVMCAGRAHTRSGFRRAHSALRLVEAVFSAMFCSFPRCSECPLQSELMQYALYLAACTCAQQLGAICQMYPWDYG